MKVTGKPRNQQGPAFAGLCIYFDVLRDIGANDATGIANLF